MKKVISNKNTMILTDKGQIEVESVKKGDIVIGFENGKLVNNKVTKIEKIATRKTHYIINNKITLFCEQSIVANNNVTHVKLLKVGDWLMTSTGKRTKIKSIEKIKSKIFYRFTVTGNHTYIANGIVLHNASRFWVLGTGTWDNSLSVNWSGTSGGAPGSSSPTASDVVTLDASSGGGVVTVNADISVTSITMGAFTGTLDFSTNNNNPTMVSFSLSGSGVRTLNMGNGNWTLSGSNMTVWNADVTTNLTLNGGNANVICSYSGSVGTRTINNSISTASGIAMPNLKITAGTDIVRVGVGGTSSFKDVIFTGFAGTLTTNTGSGLKMFGNLTLGSGMTITASTTRTFTFAATSGTQNITSNGVVFGYNITEDGVGGTLNFADALNIVTGTTITLTNGTITATGNVTVGAFSSSNANTRVLNMGNVTWTFTNTGTVWNTATTTGLTINQSGSTIKITDTSNTAITFAGGGKTYNNVWFARGASTATNTLTGANTFNDFKDNGSVAHTIIFPNATTTVTTFTVSGSVGNLITLSRTGASGTFTLASTNQPSCDYLSISNSVVSPLSGWFAGLHSTDGGGNTGWVFNPPTANKGFLALL